MPDTEFFNPINDMADIRITEACGGWIVTMPNIDQMNEDDGYFCRDHVFTDEETVVQAILRAMVAIKSIKNTDQLGKFDEKEIKRK